jgi:hypothetical protein
MVRIIISNMGIWPYGRSRVHEMRFDPSGSILHGLLNYGTGWRGTTGPPSSPGTYARYVRSGPLTSVRAHSYECQPTSGSRHLDRGHTRGSLIYLQRQRVVSEPYHALCEHEVAGTKRHVVRTACVKCLRGRLELSGHSNDSPIVFAETSFSRRCGDIRQRTDRF